MLHPESLPDTLRSRPATRSTRSIAGTTSTSLALLLALTMATASETCAQEKKPKWPKLSRSDRLTLQRSYSAYLQADKEEDPEVVRTEQLGRMVAVGPAAARWAFQRLENDGVEDPLVLVELSRRVMTPELTPLLVDELLGKKTPIHVRRFAGEYVAQRRDERFKDALAETLGFDDERCRFFAAAGLFTLGDFSRLQPVFDSAKADWAADQAYLEELLTPVRGEEAFQALDDGLRSDRERDQVTALRLARYLAPEAAKFRIGLLLDSERHNVKKEAINTLRVIVDDKAPLENLDVFKAIQFANEWKARLKS